jgi:DNA-binding transcriptional ArsR family regulator
MLNMIVNFGSMSSRARLRRRPARAAERLDRLFSALSDGTRRSMLRQLARGGATVGELARPHAISLPAVSRHLKVLEAAGLIDRTVEGRVHRCELDAAGLRAVDAWLGPYRALWEDSLDRLARYVE